MHESKHLTYELSAFSEQELISKLGLTIQDNPIGFLDEWMKRANQMKISKIEQGRLAHLQKRYNFFVRSWNAQELRLHFIIPVLDLVNFYLSDL